MSLPEDGLDESPLAYVRGFASLRAIARRLASRLSADGRLVNGAGTGQPPNARHQYPFSILSLFLTAGKVFDLTLMDVVYRGDKPVLKT